MTKLNIFFDCNAERKGIWRKEIRDTFYKSIGALPLFKEIDEVNVVIVSSHYIKELNSLYRKKNQETDILSFCYEKLEYSKKKLSSSSSELLFKIGEIFICESFLKSICKKDKIPLNLLIRDVLIHGLVHLAGFDHKKKKERLKMEKKEGEIRATSSGG